VILVPILGVFDIFNYDFSYKLYFEYLYNNLEYFDLPARHLVEFKKGDYFVS